MTKTNESKQHRDLWAEVMGANTTAYRGEGPRMSPRDEIALARRRRATNRANTAYRNSK